MGRPNRDSAPRREGSWLGRLHQWLTNEADLPEPVKIIMLMHGRDIPVEPPGPNGAGSISHFIVKG